MSAKDSSAGADRSDESAAAPAPLSGFAAKPGASGVLQHVTTRGEEVLLTVDDERGEAVLEEVTTAMVALVEQLRVAAVERMHSARKTVSACFDNEVVVRRHQAPREAAPIEPLKSAGEQSHERRTVVVVHEHRSAGNAAGRDVVRAVRDPVSR
jgi:hypothetical protein